MTESFICRRCRTVESRIPYASLTLSPALILILSSRANVASASPPRSVVVWAQDSRSSAVDWKLPLSERRSRRTTAAWFFADHCSLVSSLPQPWYESCTRLWTQTAGLCLRAWRPNLRWNMRGAGLRGTERAAFTQASAQSRREGCFTLVRVSSWRRLWVAPPTHSGRAWETEP